MGVDRTLYCTFLLPSFLVRLVTGYKKRARKGHQMPNLEPDTEQKAPALSFDARWPPPVLSSLKREGPSQLLLLPRPPPPFISHTHTLKTTQSKVVSDGHHYIYILGDYYTNSTYKFDIKNNIFTKGPDLTTIRAFSTCTRSAILNKLFVFGGLYNTKIHLNSIESILLEDFNNFNLTKKCVWNLTKAVLKEGKIGARALTIHVESRQSEMILIIGG